MPDRISLGSTQLNFIKRQIQVECSGIQKCEFVFPSALQGTWC